MEPQSGYGENRTLLVESTLLIYYVYDPNSEYMKVYTMSNLKLIFFTLFITILLTSNTYAKDYSYYQEYCEPIRKEVQEILEEMGISKDYFFLLVAESHCQNRTSRAGAKGMWQMMPATAKAFGCSDFNDLDCLTRAAARYLLHLEKKCGKEYVIFCWHDGGSNFLIKRNKVPTSGAKGLNKQFKHFLKSFYKIKENE